MLPEVISEGPTHRFGALGNVLVTLYWGAPPAEALRDRVPWVKRALSRYEGLGLLVVIDGRADGILPGAAFRDESKRQAAEYGDRFRVSASAIEGEGLKFALVRTFLRGLAVVVKARFPVRFFDDVPSACAFTAECVAADEGPDAAMLQGAVEAIRPASLL